MAIGVSAAMAIMTAVTTAAGVATGIKSSQAQQSAIDQQAKLERIRQQQKQINNLDLMERTLSAQTAAMSTTGTSMASPSFNAIQMDTLNKGFKENANLQVEAEAMDNYYGAESSKVRASLFADMFGKAASLSLSAYKAYQDAPTSQTGTSGGATKIPRIKQ